MNHRSTDCRKLVIKSYDQEKTLDRISGLPDEVLSHILSFLPTKCAVGTSILSTRWKYIFWSTTNLYFEDSSAIASNAITEEERKARKESFKRFVYLVLALHQKSPIAKFSLKCHQNTYESSDLDVWISAAILKEVQHFYLNLGHVHFKRTSFPYIFFKSRTLVVLEISGIFELEVPNSVWLPCLKVLHLNRIKFPNGDTVERFFSGCTSLIVVTLNGCVFQGGDACIYSATLEDLTIMHIYSGERILIDAPCLTKVSFHYLGVSFFWNNVYKDYQPPRVYDMSSVTYLSLQGNSLELVATHEIQAYPNVEWLELDWCSIYTWKDMINLLGSLPRLKTVIFRQGLIEHNDESNKDELEERLLHLGVHEASLSPLYVEVIEVHNFSGNDREFVLLEYLLQNAIELKSLVLYKDCSMEMELELWMAKELLRLPRTSDHCCVELI